MANNYTTSLPTTSEQAGDSVLAGTLPSTIDIIVTPDVGYTVQASDFFIGSTLPSEVTQVVFTDTTIALDITNKVRARIYLASWYVMPATPTPGYSGVVIDVDICGLTHGIQTRLSFVTTLTNTDNLTITPNFSGEVDSATDGDTVTSAAHQDINRSTTTQVYQAVFVASEGYHISNIPSFKLVSSDINKWSHIKSGHTYNSDNQLTEVTFTFNYSIGTQNVDATAGESIIWTVPSVVADATSCANVYSAYFLGLPNQSVLPVGNTTLLLFVSGSENSTYNIKIEDSVERTYDFSSNDGTFSRSLTLSDAQTIYSPAEQLLRGRTVGKNVHSITIPYSIERGEPSVKSFTTTITPTGNTFSNTNCIGTDPLVITLNQFGVIDTLVKTTTSTYGVNTATGIIKTLNDQTAISYPSTFNPTDFPTLNTGNNGFFSITDNLGYIVTDTVNGAVGSGRNLTMTNTFASKLLQVGDTVSGINIDPATVIASIDVGIPNRVVLSESVTGTVPDTTVITFTRNVGISRQPVISDFIITKPLGSGGWDPVESVVVQTVSNSATIQVDDTTGLIIGLTVQGNGIVGYPTVTAFSSDSVILSTNQTLSIGESLVFTNAMSELYISEMSVTGAGTTSCKLNVEGYIQRVGNENVTGDLTLNNFITTYADPTAATIATTCMLGESIIISPIPDCTGHTGTLNIISTSGGTGTRTISGDGQHIIYTAPSSGTSDSTNYTVSDGVNVDSASITITLTSY